MLSTRLTDAICACLATTASCTGVRRRQHVHLRAPPGSPAATRAAVHSTSACSPRQLHAANHGERLRRGLQARAELRANGTDCHRYQG